MTGFGKGPFGAGSFGEWYWSLFNFVGNIPDVYRQQDLEQGDGTLNALLEGVAPSLDGIRQKIRDYDILRDPIRCPIETDFLRPITILKTETLTDGTSRVYISNGPDADKFKGIRPGMVLIDFRGLRFSVCSVVSAARAADVEDPPSDPETGELIAKHLIIQNIGQASTEFVPFVSGSAVTAENPAPSPVDDGINEGPYLFTVANAPVARNRVTVTWEEAGETFEGFFTNDGSPGGDLADTSTIDFDPGTISLDTGRQTPIDADTIRVTYTEDVPFPVTVSWVSGASYVAGQSVSSAGSSYTCILNHTSDRGNEPGVGVSWEIYWVIVEDAEIRAQNILAFLAGDYGIALDRNDPEVLQRSYVYNAYQLWNIKGTALGYDVLGKLAGYSVDAKPLHKVTAAIASGLGSGTVFEFPAGSGTFFTTVEPRKALLDEVVLDAMPLDLLCCEDAYPGVAQAVTVDSVTPIGTQGSRKLNRVVVSIGADDLWITGTGYVVGNSVQNGGTSYVCILAHTSGAANEPGGASPSWTTYWVASGGMEDSYFTCAEFQDSALALFEPESFVRIDETTYQFDVIDFGVPSLGAATMTWHVLKTDVSPAPVEITPLGVQTVGFTGWRYRIETVVLDPITADLGNWKYIDNEGNISIIESYEFVAGSIYRFEFVSAVAPVAGVGRIFYDCEIVTDCSFCRASSIVTRISPTTVLNFPEALEGDALDRLILRLKQMIPAHVRIAAFVFDPGPAVALWGPIAASGTSDAPITTTAYYTGFYDIEDFFADALPTDVSPITVTSEVTITNENVLEEYLGGDDPIVDGTWTATGLWHTTEYRSSTQFRSFQYGQNDVGRVGDVGSVPPDYATGAVTTGVLTSPVVPNVPAGSTVTLRFRHFVDVRGGASPDILEIRAVNSVSTTVRTITKADMGVAGGGSTGGNFVTLSFSVPEVVNIGTFTLEFEFNSVSTNPGSQEGWYVDDIEVQVTP